MLDESRKSGLLSWRTAAAETELTMSPLLQQTTDLSASRTDSDFNLSCYRCVLCKSHVLLTERVFTLLFFYLLLTMLPWEPGLSSSSDRTLSLESVSWQWGMGGA